MIAIPRKHRARLQALDRQLAEQPDDIAALSARASLLRKGARSEEAKRDFLARLARAPTHLGASAISAGCPTPSALDYGGIDFAVSQAG